MRSNAPIVPIRPGSVFTAAGAERSIAAGRCSVRESGGALGKRNPESELTPCPRLGARLVMDTKSAAYWRRGAAIDDSLLLWESSAADLDRLELRPQRYSRSSLFSA